MDIESNYQFSDAGNRKTLMPHVHPAVVAMAWANGNKKKAIAWLSRRVSECQDSAPILKDGDVIVKGLTSNAARAEIGEAIDRLKSGATLTDREGCNLRGTV